MNTTRSLLALLAACSAFALPLRAQTPAAPATKPAAPAAASPAAAQVAPDFTDMRSYILLGKAWAAKEAADDATVMVYTGKIIEVYTPQAISMQKSLTEPLPPADKEKVFSMWALNDVGTAYFLKGQSLEKMGKPKEAVEAYKFLTENLPFAQCWDTKGWFWKPASAAAERIQALQFDAVK